MTITAPPTVDALPEPPNPADRLTFNSKAYPWSLALGDMTTEMNSVASWTYSAATQTETNAHLAQSAAAAAALQAPDTTATSTETITFGTGSKTFQVPTGKSYVAGQYVLVAQTSAPSNYMIGQVTSYDNLTGVLILNVVTNTGSGSASAWTFSLTSPPTTQLISGAADKATPVDADIFGYLDSAASFVFKKFTWANLKSFFVGKTGNQTMAGTLTLPSNGLTVGTNQLVVSGGFVGAGTTTPKAPLHTVNAGNSGPPDAAGTGTTGVSARIQGLSVNTDFGVYASGITWIQNRSNTDNATTFQMVLNPVGGAVLVGPGGMGYNTGAGGSVTQLTSKATAVTLNKICGVILTNNAALAAGATVSFQVNNSQLGAYDMVNVQVLADAGSGVNYRVEVVHSTAGSFTVRITNLSAGSLSDVIGLKFLVIKGVNA